MHLSEAYSKYQYPGGWGDKGTAHSYIDVYEEQMTKKSNIDILEIGVMRGHSIKMWQDYFIDSNIYGIDINLSNLEFSDCHNVYICDATSPEQINNTFGDKKFDYVVDDGSHFIDHQISSFDILWPRIKSGGKYFIEDIDGEEAISRISNHLKNKNVDFVLFDNRNVKQLWNDMIFMMEKPL
jgi:hypothetical protein